MPLTAIRRIVAAIRRWREHARSRQQLRALSDHLLKDIGLRREDVGYEFPNRSGTATDDPLDNQEDHPWSRSNGIDAGSALVRRRDAGPATLARQEAKMAQRIRTASASFFWSARLLPASRRKAMQALYGFCRELGDISDGEASRTLKLTLLGDWRDRDRIALCRPATAPRDASAARPSRDV